MISTPRAQSCAKASTGNRLVTSQSESAFTELYLVGPKNPPPDESPGWPDPAFQRDRDESHESVFTISLQSYLHWSSAIPWGSPRCNMFHFRSNNTVWPAWLKSHSTLRGPYSHPPCNNKQEPRKKPLCFGVNPGRRVHAGILIYGDCWVLTLPVILVNALHYFLELLSTTKYGLQLLGKKEDIK